MKTQKLFRTLLLLVLLAFATALKAQTCHQVLVIKIDGLSVWCLNRVVTGTLYYNFGYHLDRKTGKIDNIHSNVLHADLRDAETGIKYNLIDTQNDRLGTWWDFFNYPNASNGLPDLSLYNVSDGWLNAYMPDTKPTEGTMNYMVFKIIGGGEMFYIKSLIQLHMNANGEITAEVVKEEADCNE